MRKYVEFIEGADGKPVPGASVRVLTYPGGALATIYEDSAGAHAIANPLTTDSTGGFSFYVADGHYSLELSGRNLRTKTITDIAIFEESAADRAEASAAAAASSADAAAAIVLGNFLQTGVGAAARSYSDKAREIVNLADFLLPGHVADIAAGTSTYDCTAALYAAINSVGYNASTFYTGVRCIRMLPGKQCFASAIQLKKTVRLMGDNGGMAGGYTTRMHFTTADTAGIVVNRYDTLGDVADSPTSTGGDNSMIEGIWISGSGGTPSLLKSGVRMRARAVVRNCLISGFAGAGICISADTSVASSDPYHGNANNWRVESCRLEQNKYCGLYVSGGDANAGVAILVDASVNGRFGINDRAFLGNTYIGCHADANGMYNIVSGLTETSVVHYAGNRYYLVDGQDANGASTTPGTNSAVWVLTGAGGVHANIPTWDGGITQTYVSGGSYGHGGSSNNSTFTGCYYETGQAPPQIGNAAIVLGGFMGNGLEAGGAHLRGTSKGLTSQRAFSQTYTYTDASTVSNYYGGPLNVTDPPVLRWNSSAATAAFNPAAEIVLKQTRATGDTYLDFYGVSQPVRFNGYSTAKTYGRDTAVANRYTTEIAQFILGHTTNPLVQGRRFGMNTATPALDGAVGEVIHNSAPTAGGFAGWVCTTAGTSATPATWQQWGLINGGGGTVTQTANKGNAVTLNKRRGQITMEATASIAAGAIASFTLNNTIITSADDNIVIHRKSGGTAGSYRVWVDSVAVGSCVVCVENRTAGALAEQPVLQFTVLAGAIA